MEAIRSVVYKVTGYTDLGRTPVVIGYYESLERAKIDAQNVGEWGSNGTVSEHEAVTFFDALEREHSFLLNDEIVIQTQTKFERANAERILKENALKKLTPEEIKVLGL